MDYIPEYIQKMYPTPPDKPDYERMAQACLDAVEGHPEDRDYLLGYAAIYLHYCGKYREAIEHDRKYLPSLTNQKCKEEMERFLMYSLEKTGDLEGALEQAEHIMRTDKNHGGFVYDDAIRLAKLLKRNNKVIELTKLEIEDNDENVDTEVFEELAKSYDEKKEYMLSYEYYVKAAQSVPDSSSWLWNNAGRALALAGKEDEAMFYFQMALKLNPKSAYAHYYIGQLLQNKDDVYRAMHHYAEALKIQPKFPEVYNNMAAINLSEESDISMAIQNLEKALESNPDPHILTLLYMNLSRMHKKLANYDQHEYYKGKMMESLGFDVDYEEGDEDEENEGDDVSLN